MTQLLIDEPPLQVLPSLATEIGLNEAIVLQQFHYWLQRSNNIKDGYKWIYNSYKGWNEQFPFWSNATLRRAIGSLEKQGYLIAGNYNKAGFDKTKWYRINYEKMGVSKRVAQNEQTSCSNCTNGVAQNEQTNTNRLPETTSETNNTHCHAKARLGFAADVKTIIDYLNEKTHKHFGYDTETTKRKIKARFNEGFTLDDFKTVIDIKTAEWLHNPNKNQYLRPITLFGNKFESYLNQVPKQTKKYYSKYENIF